MTIKDQSPLMAPSLWEGWGRLLFVYRITYPHTPCRRITYPPEQGKLERLLAENAA